MKTEQKDTKHALWLGLLAGIALIGICGLIVAALGGLALFPDFSDATSADITSNAIIKSVVEDGSIEEGTTSPEGKDKATARELPSNNPTALPQSPAEPGGTPRPQTPSATVQPGPTPSEEIESDEAARARELIEENVTELRGLMPLHPVTPTYLSTLELTNRLEDEFSENYSLIEARNDAITLNAFDFMAPDFDIYTFTINLLTEQIAGFYDPESDEFVIIRDNDEFTPLEQWTHVHEYVHALQDQHFDLDSIEDKSLDSEASFALQALAEGDATLVQTLYLLDGYFSQDQMADIMADALEVDTKILDRAPPVIASQLQFPYLGGLEFVQTLYQQGGFPAINQAWNNPPVSTEHILHPDRYLDGDLPKIVTVEPLTDTLGAGWTLASEDILGEFYLREYLAQQLEIDDVDVAAKGWGGDRYAVYWHEDRRQTVMILKIAWDTTTDAQEFNSLYPYYPQRALSNPIIAQSETGICWQGDVVICLSLKNNISYVVKAPNLALASAIASVQIP